jgi:hypothetical protein
VRLIGYGVNNGPQFCVGNGGFDTRVDAQLAFLGQFVN